MRIGLARYALASPDNDDVCMMIHHGDDNYDVCKMIYKHDDSDDVCMMIEMKTYEGNDMTPFVRSGTKKKMDLFAKTQICCTESMASKVGNDMYVVAREGG